MNKLILITLLATSVFLAKADWDYTEAKGRPLVIGHRGYAGQFPENTLESFNAAW